MLVLLTTRSPRAGRVGLQARLGVRVSVRVPGRIMRRLFLGGLQSRRAQLGRRMSVSVVNRGNITLRLRGNVAASLYRRGKPVAGIRTQVPRALPPGSRALLELRYRGRLRGPATVLLHVRLGRGLPGVERRYRIRL